MLCPDCRCELSVHAAYRKVTCLHCGFIYELSAEIATDITMIVAERVPSHFHSLLLDGARYRNEHGFNTDRIQLTDDYFVSPIDYLLADAWAVHMAEEADSYEAAAA
jgi:hypothetical protein